MSARFIPLSSIDVSDWQSLREAEVAIKPTAETQTDETPARPFRVGDVVVDTRHPERRYGVVTKLTVGIDYPVYVEYIPAEDDEILPDKTYTYDGRWWHDEPPSLKHVD